ncbi:MAG: DUF853 family protein [Vicinamibacteria bacterium]|jgi:hypothetical protein|nr:DUF853 family protein [Vicinamibacteria bacterium]
MTDTLNIGKVFDSNSGQLQRPLDLDARDLLTHGLIVGMTGSGKTGLAVALIEEVLRQGVPVLAIDPKGDLANLLLLFDDLSPAAFAPWIDTDSAVREKTTVEALAAKTAEAWRQGWQEWGLSAVDAKSLRQGRAACVYTPGSSSGCALNILQSLEAPSVPFDRAVEDLRDEIAGIVAGLLGMLQIPADPLRSKPAMLLGNLIEHAWRDARGLTIESLIVAIADPPFEKLGALPIESVYPRREREELMLALNGLLAAPSFASWREGVPLDIDALLRTPDGRPRLSILYTAHLSDDERAFVTALVLDKVKTWMRRQPGTSTLRALVYMDEIFGYFPPHPANPPTKRPLLTLLKQARAQGVGVVLATQNPVDLDYKGLANIGTWMIGRLQTEQDRARLMEGLIGTGVDSQKITTLLDATRKRVFLLHDVHRDAPCLIHSRWTYAYLRGPLTRDELSRLPNEPAQSVPSATSPGQPAAAVAAPQAAAPVAAPASTAAGPPMLPAPFKHHYFAKYGGELADPYLFVKYAVRYKGAGETIACRAYPLNASVLTEILEGEPIAIEERSIVDAAPSAVRHADVPGIVASAGAKGIEKVLKDRLSDKLVVTIFYDPLTRSSSQAGETREAFAARLGVGGAERAVEKLREKLTAKELDLKAREQDLSGRKTEKWAAVGTAVLSNIGLVFGRKRTISGAGAVLSKNRMENAAEARIAALQNEIVEIKEEIEKHTSVDPAHFEERLLEPARTDVKILRYDWLWVY